MPIVGRLPAPKSLVEMKHKRYSEFVFRFFKRQKGETASHPDYRTEFHHRTRALYEQFAIGDTPYEELLDAMQAVDHEMNHHGGCNWNDGDYDDYLGTIQQHLAADPQFSPSAREKIKGALADIAACGDELNRIGESSRPIEDSIDYPIARVVGWCRSHEPSDQQQ
jgi:hypothetical protein